MELFANEERKTEVDGTIFRQSSIKPEYRHNFSVKILVLMTRWSLFNLFSVKRHPLCVCVCVCMCIYIYRPRGKESTEVRKTQNKGKESENSY